MAILNQNIRIYKGDDIIARYTIEDVSELVDYKAWWAMSPKDDLTNLLIVKTTAGDFSDEGGIEIEDNLVKVSFASEDTDEASGIDVDEYYCELQLEDDDGNTIVSAEGTAHVRPALRKRGVV